jgi:hypothetical protein
VQPASWFVEDGREHSAPCNVSNSDDKPIHHDGLEPIPFTIHYSTGNVHANQTGMKSPVIAALLG